MSQSSELTCLMRAAVAGDPDAYRHGLVRLAAHIRTLVWHKCKRTGQGLEDVEDLVQETLLAVHLKLHTWNTGSAIEPWVRAIATHKFIDQLRRRKGVKHVDIDELSEDLASDVVDSEVTAIDRDHLIASLPARQRRIVEAFSIEGRSARDIAAELDMTEGAVRVALHRAIKALARLANSAGA